MDVDRLLSDRSKSIDASGIRRVFDLGARLKDPCNLSIGQPDFTVPDTIKQAAMDAIDHDRNGYTVTQGIAELRERISEHLSADVGWNVDLRSVADADPDAPAILITSGTSGALLLAVLAMIDPGDEVVVPDPYFVMYPHIVQMASGTVRYCDTYPDFRMTAERVEPLLTDRTKIVLANSPSNPSGVVMTSKECEDLEALCRERGVLLLSDEIYDEFTYSDAREASRLDGVARCPSPCRTAGSTAGTLLVRGFGKTYGVTGWRLGYAAGPRAIIEEMAKLQQYTFVCAPTPLQWGAMAALDTDMTEHVDAYRKRRDMVVERLSSVTDVAVPGGAFYAFPKVPDHLGIAASEFIERCIEREVLVIPGNVFSRRDTHFRLSYATNERSIERGLDQLVDLMS